MHLLVDKRLFLTEVLVVKVKSVRIRSFSSPYFTSFGLNTEYLSVLSLNSVNYVAQKKSEYGYSSLSVKIVAIRCYFLRAPNSER